VTEEDIELQGCARGCGQAKAEHHQSKPKRRAAERRQRREISDFGFRTSDFDWGVWLHKPICLPLERIVRQRSGINDELSLHSLPNGFVVRLILLRFCSIFTG